MNVLKSGLRLIQSAQCVENKMSWLQYPNLFINNVPNIEYARTIIYNIERGLSESAYHGSMELVNLFIEKGANRWNDALFGTAEGGHRDLVNLFIEKGANRWNDALYYAAQGGHLELVKFFVEKCADNYKNIRTDNPEIKAYLQSLKYPGLTDYISDEICTICYSSNGDAITKCGHIFHRECVEKWFEINSHCPVCRK